MKTLTTLLLAATTLLFSSCASCPLGHKTTAKGKIEHVVLVWLKRPGNAEDQAKLVATGKDFQAKLPQIKHLSVGRALPSDREVVDDSFDVAFVMRFDNAADLAAYEKHPVHTEAVQKTLRPLAQKLLVYDIACD